MSGVKGPIHVATLSKDRARALPPEDLEEHLGMVQGATEHLRSSEDIILGKTDARNSIPKMPSAAATG